MSHFPNGNILGMRYFILDLVAQGTAYASEGYRLRLCVVWLLVLLLRLRLQSVDGLGLRRGLLMLLPRCGNFPLIKKRYS